MANEKAGYKTTEFWVTAVVVIMGLLVSSGALPANLESMVGLLVAAIGGGAYTIGRSGVKKNANSLDQ